MSPDFAVFIF